MATPTHPDRVLFAGGGTGGHLYMALAIAGELRIRYPSLGVLFTGTAEGIESRVLPGLGFELKTLRIGGFKKVGLKRRLRTLFQIPMSLLSSLRIAREFRPSLVVGVGGYSSGPVVAACRLLSIPALILEPNVYPGLANRLLGRFVQGAAVAYAETARWFGDKARLTGIPIRREFFAIEAFDQPASPVKVLVFGGSQGSQAINSLLLEALRRIDAKALTLVHQTGPANYEAVRQSYEEAGYLAEVTPYLDDMPARFEWADLIICRAGASTIAELTAAGRASILIPFPHAADDHQKRNALAMVNRGAAILLEQETADGRQLAQQIQRLAESPDLLRKMAEACRSMSKPNATKEIVDLIEELVC